MLLKNISKDIKRKKELKDLDDKFVLLRVKDYLKKNNLEIKEEDFKNRNKKYIKFFKDMRRELRIVYGVFRNVKDKRSLESYKEIFSLIGKFNSLLDLGCGLNPLDYAKLNKNSKYYCGDVNVDEIKNINEYLKKNKIKGKGFIFDLIYDDLGKLPRVDVVFLFRVLESLEYYERNISKDILKKLKSKLIIVSFAKNVLSKRGNIRKKGRSWFRRILSELNYEYKDYDIENEIFFVIRK
ncbi:hypothetical protein CL617_02720 [archaeon]|nr:hypothetical protein [archaeon]|tara:strand:- start:7096 stop:7812 length:717 start_codon:yes stop_codon:yes gene_type:complete